MQHIKYNTSVNFYLYFKVFLEISVVESSTLDPAGPGAPTPALPGSPLAPGKPGAPGSPGAPGRPD